MVWAGLRPAHGSRCYRIFCSLDGLLLPPLPLPGCCTATGGSSNSSFLTGAPAASVSGRRGLVGIFLRGAPGGSDALGAGMVWFCGVAGSGCTACAQKA